MSSINHWKNKRTCCIIFVALLAVSLITTPAFIGCGNGGGDSSEPEPVPEEQQPNLLKCLLTLAVVAAIVAILCPHDDCEDLDGDGYGAPADPSCLYPELDCDDTDPSVNPGAAEVVDDGIDQDCNGADTITCVVDADMDGYGTDVGTTVLAPDGSCDTVDGESLDSTDCDDSDPSVNPGAAEVADDGIDQDCNGSDTITCIVDADMDGYGTDVGTTVLAPDGSCDTADGESNDSTDCDDSESEVNPGIEESFAAGNCSDGVDNDCDGMVDLDEACFMAQIPAGEFVMGSDSGEGSEGSTDEMPEHVVYLSGYEIDLYEVTNEEFAEFLNDYGSNISPEGYEMLDDDDEDRHISWDGSSWYAEGGYEDHPVIEVTWYGANTYCDYYGKRLPTEAEWEKAARGGCEVGGDPGICEDPADERTYPWGEGFDCDHANHSNCVGDTTPVGSYPLGVSPYGVYDMAGNVWEWVKDWYAPGYYDDSPYQDPQGPGSGTARVLRSSSFLGGSVSLRVAYRSGYGGHPDYSGFDEGFRCAR